MSSYKSFTVHVYYRKQRWVFTHVLSLSPGLTQTFVCLQVTGFERPQTPGAP